MSIQRMAKAPVRVSTPDMGPAILASGYLTKRTQSLNRWKKRWWQLTDDGILLYFKSEERAKVLGEIDVARSCYDVKLGAERCGIDFPRDIPSSCCLSFSVLKRTFYLYASTAAEARRWAESLGSVSLVLNPKRKTQRPATGLQQRGQAHAYPHRSGQTNARLWLDGSPQPAGARHSRDRREPGPRSHSASLSQPLSASYSDDLRDRLHLNEPWVMDSKGVLRPRQRQVQPQPPYKDTEGYELPPKPQSVNVSTLPQKGAQFPLEHQVCVPVLPFLSQDSGQNFMTEAGLVRHKHPPPPVKPKPILKKTRRREGEDVMPTRSFNVNSPTESESSVAVTTAQVYSDDQPPAIPPKRPSLRVSVDCKSGQSDIFLPSQPDIKPPPPPDTHSESSSPMSANSSERGVVMEKQTPPKTSIRRTTWMNGHSQSHSKGQDADSWAWEQLHQLAKEIKRLGMPQPDGTVCVAFSVLQDRTDGTLEDLLATLTTAKRLQILSYDTDVLVKGRDDAALITLVRNVR